ncbi:hypothetical protein ACLMJK_003260 [Lecanora helva]
MVLSFILSIIVALLINPSPIAAWLPSSGKIRGVNLGSQFVVEPWMASNEWSSMGCDSSSQSEFDCVSQLGQSQANAAWAKHWASWIIHADITEMKSYGLNTIRVPVGYWIREDIVYSDSEHFPQGGLKYLEQICGWASDAGLYVIIDLHGAPGAQVANNADTGQYNPNPGFYAAYNYERAFKFLEWMTHIIHTNAKYKSVGMLEIVNEPEMGNTDHTNSMRDNYYPGAFERIRAAEANLNVSTAKTLHVQMMNTKWNSGNPNQYLSKNDSSRAYDDHRYLKYDNTIGSSPDAYLQASCSDDRGGDSPTIVGEWSLSLATILQDNDVFAANQANAAWYTKWFEAQVQAYEKQLGWIFWSWRTDLDDWRWDYKAAVAAGVIPKNLDDVADSNPCAGGS